MSLEEEKSRPREEMYSKSSLTSQLVLDIVHMFIQFVIESRLPCWFNAQQNRLLSATFPNLPLEYIKLSFKVTED